MKYIYLSNGQVGLEILRWLVGHSQPPVGLVVHPAENGKHRDEIIETAGLNPEYIFDGSTLRMPETLAAIQALRPDLGLSVLFDYILKEAFLELFPLGCLNLHPALLPYNRGQYPNVWSIIEDTPSGVTLHYIDRGIDTGDVVAQKEVPVEPTDTGESLYQRLEQACIQLFCEVWPMVIGHNVKRIPQIREAGTYHKTRDVDAIDKIDLDRRYTARQLINILRARTFPPYRGAYFIHKSQRIYLRLDLEKDSGK